MVLDDSPDVLRRIADGTASVDDMERVARFYDLKLFRVGRRDFRMGRAIRKLDQATHSVVSASVFVYLRSVRPYAGFE